MKLKGFLNNFARDLSHEHTKIEFITYIYIIYCPSSINFQFTYNLAGFLDILNFTRHNEGLGTAKNVKFPRLTSWRYALDVRQTSVNKQRYWRVLTQFRPNSACNRSVHEAMKKISSVKVDFRLAVEM